MVSEWGRREVRTRLPELSEVVVCVWDSTIPLGAGRLPRGHYLWPILDDEDALLAHLGTSGQILITSPDAAVAGHDRARSPSPMAAAIYASTISAPSVI